MGWSKYIENKLTVHGETYLVAVKWRTSSDVDDNPVLKVEIAYLEEAMRFEVIRDICQNTGITGT